MGVIYKITSPTGRVYIGKTYNLSSRIASYKHDLKKDRYTTVLFMSLKKYGWDSHIMQVIEEVESERMSEREIFWIKELKTFHLDSKYGMNMTRGGEAGGGPWMHDVERRKKQSKRFSGEGGTFYGKTHTEEWRKKKSKEVSEYNKKIGWKVPQWGAEKGWAAVRKHIVAYNNNGNKIGEYESITEAAKILNINIQGIKDSLKYKQWHIGAYFFKYKKDETPTVPIDNIGVKAEKRPVLFLSEYLEVMSEYPSAYEASQELKLPVTSIRRAALYNYTQPLRTGHIFIYKDIFEKLNLN